MSKNENIPEFKIITLGNSGVGKTSIIKRFINQKFEEDMISTIGFGFSSKIYTLKDGTKIKFKLIDTAGQESFHALSSNYLKNAEGMLFVFALNVRKSFEDITGWINSLKENNQDINKFKVFPAYLIGSKSDLEHKISEDEIQEFTKENNFYGYIETSAKDNIGIEQTFQEMAEMLVKIFGKKKNKQNIILASKNEKKTRNNKCTLCKPDV